MIWETDDLVGQAQVEHIREGEVITTWGGEEKQPETREDMNAKVKQEVRMNVAHEHEQTSGVLSET